MIQNVKPQLESLTEKDVLITPKLGDLSSADFKKSEEFIQLGQEAALAILPKLQRYAVTPEQFAQWSKSRTEKHLVNLPIATEAIVGVKRVNPEVIESVLDVSTGKPLDLPQFHQKLEKVYAGGDFSQLDYELIRNDHSSDLIVRPIEKSWGPNYLNLGLSFGTDFEGSTPWNISALYRRTWINSLGAEWKTNLTIGSSQEFKTEFYQPLRLDGLLFIAPYLSYNEEPLSLWFDKTQYATFKYATSSLGVDLGSTVSKFGELRVGVSANKYKMTQDVGPPVLSTGNATDYGVNAALLFDQLDNYFFPKEGQYLKLDAYASIANDKQINEYGRISGEFKAAVPTSSGTSLFTVRGQVYTGDIPFYADVKWLGGFLNLSSFKYQELLTDKYLYASAQYYQTMAWLSSGYWGVALEAGKVFDKLNTAQYQDINLSATAYIAYDSYLGPIYLGASYGNNETWSAYFMLGKQF
ncbi:BamA/TamA family outer membrane protein [Chitinibacter bivalviorum]